MTNQKSDRLKAETERTHQMYQFERKYASFGMVCGIDEAGRGPIAGPVVAAAVILPDDHEILYLNDSKKLTPKKRDELYEILCNESVSYAIGTASPQTIDQINILQATYAAMRDAVLHLNPLPQVLLNDAVRIPEITIRQVPIVHGDALSASIAAASILAKVTRDRMMQEYDSMFPQYGFAKHKGYGTKEHKEALLKYGPCAIHRQTFLRTFLKR